MKTEEALGDLRLLSVDFRGQVGADWLDIISIWLQDGAESFQRNSSSLLEYNCFTSVSFFCTATWISHESESHSVVSDSLWPHGLKSTRLLCPWNFPGRNTGVGSHSLLQGIFPTQRLNPGLPHCRWILYHLSSQENPKDFWSGMLCPPPGDLPNPGIKPRFPALRADSLLSEPPGKPTCMHIFLLSGASHPHPRSTPLGHPRSLSWAPGAVRQFPPAIQLTHARVYIPVLPSQFILTSPAPPVSPSPFSTSEPVPDLQICSSPFF